MLNNIIDTVACGECVNLMQSLLPSDCIDLTVTSPPYDTLREYNGFEFDYRRVIDELWRVTKPGGVVVWVVADETIDGNETGTSFKQALYFKSVGFNLFDTMIYTLAGPGAKGSHYTYWQGFEYMFVLSKGKPRTINLIRDRLNVNVGVVTRGERRRRDGAFRSSSQRVVPPYSKRTNVWRVGQGNTRDRGHPAVFPASLPRDHIISWSRPSDIVLDPLCGIGTTCIEAKKLGRRFLGFDISREYIELAQRYLLETQSPLFSV